MLRNTLRTLKFGLLGASLVTAGAVANAQPNVERVASGYVGINGGYGMPTGVNGRFSYGAEAGMLHTSGTTISLFYKGSDDKQKGQDIRIEHYGLGGDWSLSGIMTGWLGGFHAGVRAGSETLKYAGMKTENEFTYGPNLGYDFWNITNTISLGADATMFFSGGPKHPSTLYAMAAMKFWF